MSLDYNIRLMCLSLNDQQISFLSYVYICFTFLTFGFNKVVTKSFSFRRNLQIILSDFLVHSFKPSKCLSMDKCLHFCSIAGIHFKYINQERQLYEIRKRITK